jgi:hypothetical protein
MYGKLFALVTHSTQFEMIGALWKAEFTLDPVAFYNMTAEMDYSYSLDTTIDVCTNDRSYFLDAEKVKFSKKKQISHS